ncbi:hypothetical protein WMF04_25555 [Sorangium sp. So ce260]|uniref:hypothetical protein n=1 Tax=Sorangium sp. So ce260 TaxID=3133291 RepID=UPI003F628187
MSVTAPELDFETHDGFLHAVLGLLGASREIAYLASAAAAAGRPAGEEGHVPEDGGAEDAVLLALLGILSLGGRAQQIAETWAEGPPPAEGSPPAKAAFRPVADILR